VTGIGPRAGSEADRTPQADDVAADAGTWAAQQAYQLGREHATAELTDPQAGYNLGHDVGLGARTGQGRAYTVRLMQGHADGLEARHELMEAAERGQAAATARDAHARLGARQADPQPEPEAEAG